MDERRIAGADGRILQVRPASRRTVTRARRQRFLDTLAATCNVRLSAREAGMDQAYCYRLRAQDTGFAEAWRAALAMGYDRLEEALVAYAMARVEAAAIDPGAVDAATVPGSVQAAIAQGTVSNADLQFAMALLNRHRGTMEGRGPVGGRQARRATQQETDEALRKKLASLARRMGGA